MDRKFNKFIPNTQMLTFHALKHSLSSAANWSSALGGPRISTIKRACKPRINILPFIDSENLAAHIRQYKEILKKYNNVSDFSKVPLQVSFDATAVTGRFQSRKLRSRCSDNVDRIFFFLMGDGLLKVQRMGTSPFHSPKVSAHKKLSAVV